MSFAWIRRLWPRSLRWSIVVWITGLQVASLAIGFFWVHHVLRAVLESEDDAFLTRTAVELSAVVRDTDERGSAALDAEIHREVEAHESKGLVVISRQTELPMVAPENSSSRDLAEGLAKFRLGSTPQTIRLDDGRRFRALQVSAKLSEESELPLELALSLTPTDETLARFDRQVATGGLMFLLLSFLGAWYLARQSVRPISLSIQTARQLNPSDLTARLPRTGIGDELDQLASTINELLERLATYHAQIARFTADASHELRSPLAAMRAAIEVSLQQPRSEVEYCDMLGSLAEQCDRLTGLVNSLLLLARGDAGQVELRRQPVDLDSVAAQVVELYQPLAEDRGITLGIESGARPVIVGDATLLQQLISNLVDNALKFSNTGGHVHVRIDSIKEHFRIVVEDNGVGIPPKKLPYIFERFYQADTARSSEGSGLGLSICRWIVEVHGGAIDIVSRERCTIATVTFPQPSKSEQSTIDARP